MRLLLDENLSPSHAAYLRWKGHDAVAEVGLSGQPDEVIRSYAIANDRVLLTLDADFANISRFPPARTPGVIRMKIHPPTEASIRHQIEFVLAALQGQSMAGRLAVSQGEIIRVRH